jgi:hypothetical protein
VDDDYLCLNVLSKSGESAGEFKARLSAFWTHMLRSHHTVFEKVYAEYSEFETKGEYLVRRYLIQTSAVPDLEPQLLAGGMGFEPIDENDVYSRYEAAPPDWFWIEH